MVNFTVSFFIQYHKSQYSILNSTIMGKMKQCNFMKYRNVKLSSYKRNEMNNYMMLLYHSDLLYVPYYNMSLLIICPYLLYVP